MHIVCSILKKKFLFFGLLFCSTVFKKTNMDDLFSPGPSHRQSSSSDRMQTNEVNDNISIVPVPFQSAGVVLMNHPASLTLYKYVSVSVLSGTVSINGCEMNNKSNPIQVFSSEKTGLIEIITESSESIWRKKTSAADLETYLGTIFHSDKFSKKILQNIGNSTVAVYVKRCVLPPNVEFVEFYFPQAFEFNLCQRSAYKDCYCLLKNKKAPIRFGEDEEKVASEITVLIRKAKLTDSKNPRIIVCGPRKSGKTTLLHYLINKMLSEYQAAYYLDTDPGQPEFTPPGVVSLTEIKKPIIGPPFFHQNRNAKMMFTGSISPDFVDLYNKNISKLMELYNSEHTDDPLFVNTMGWMQGVGLEFLRNVIAAVQPTVLVEIVAKDEISMFDYRDYLPSDSQYFQVCCNHERKTVFSPKEMRELSLVSHLGKSQKAYLRPQPINKFKPYRVSWDKIALFVFPGGSLLPSRMVEAINGSIVALCSVPETSILKSNIPEFPITLEPEPDNECLAYGLVLAADEREHMLYVISHLKIDELAKVNALIKGNIMTPDALILKQEIYDVPLPHTQVDKISLSDEETEDTSMISLKYLLEAETESPTTSSNMFPPVENYRRPIGKRYRHKFSKN